MTNNKYLNLYIDFLSKSADVKKPLKIVFDCSNGTTGLVLKKFKTPNSKFYILNSNPNGRFPAHGPNPLLAGAMGQLQRAVLKHKADLGVAFDADGDRAFFTDNKGRIVPSFTIAELLFLENSNPFVADLIVFKALEKLGITKEHKIFPSRVGTYFVKDLMRRKKATIVAEFSGHYYFKDFFYSDSGIITAIKVMNAVSQLSYSLADFWDLGAKGFSLVNFDVRVKNQSRFLRKITEKYRKKAVEISKLDGITFDFGDSFLIVRPSNTEPLLRFFVGGKDGESVKKTKKEIKALI